MSDADPFGWRPRRLSAANLAVAAFEAGNHDPEAPTVLLVHGLGHWTDAAWSRLLPQLDPAFRYVGFDLPGFGASEKPDVAYDLPFFRAVLDGVVDALGLERFALVGHSLGGFLAADYAGTRPERVDSLALIAPAGFARTPRLVLLALASSAARRLFMRRPSRRFVERVLRRGVVAKTSLPAEHLERAYALSQDAALRRAFAGVYSGAMAAFARSETLHAQFARYHGPVLCAWGRHDRYVPHAAMREVVRVYPKAQALTLEHSAHLPMLEEPRRLATALNAFLIPTRAQTPI